MEQFLNLQTLGMVALGMCILLAIYLAIRGKPSYEYIHTQAPILVDNEENLPTELKEKIKDWLKSNEAVNAHADNNFHQAFMWMLHTIIQEYIVKINSIIDKRVERSENEIEPEDSREVAGI